MLRAGLSRASRASEWVLGNPKAWLGTVYHAVLERVSKLDLARENLAPDLDHLWGDAVSKVYETAKEHPLDRRFGVPTTWPGYYLAWANMRLRAQQLLKEKSTAVREPKCGAKGLLALPEHAFSAMGGKLTGRPDLVCEDEILDYKTGEIFEEDSNSQGVVLKSAYVRQLHLYGYLVRETLGRTPHRGILLPVEGEPVEVPLDPTACENEALEAVDLLDRYNAFVSEGADTKDLATPSTKNCRWCSYKGLCPSFWANGNESWFDKLDGEVARGKMLDSPKQTQDSQCFSLSILIDGGTLQRTTVDISPVDADVHPDVGALVQGDRVRITGLGRRQDGRVFPWIRTLVFREADLPQIKVMPVSEPRELQSGGKVPVSDR